MKTNLPYVYKCVNNLTGEYYFGYRAANKINAYLDIGIHYFTSSKFIRKHKDLFKFEVIAEYEIKDDAYKHEQMLIKEHINDILCINKNLGGTPRTKDYRWFTDGTIDLYIIPGQQPVNMVPGRSNVKSKKGLKGELNPMYGKIGPNNPNYGKKRTDEFKKQQSDRNMGKCLSEETRLKISKSNKGKLGLKGDLNPSTRLEVKEKISKSRIGKKASDETKKKMSTTRKGRPRKPHTQETKDKIGTANSGKNHGMYGKHLSKESKQKISESNKGRPGPMLGKNHTDESKQKMSDSSKKYIRTPEHAAKLKAAVSLSNKTRIVTPESNLKRSKTIKAKFMSKVGDECE